MARKPVVTAFVRNEEGNVLLVQRSPQVSTYQGFWGGISGGVEGDESLLGRALQEINEEVGLPSEQLQLVTTGRPLPVDDSDRHFLVYPFLFHCPVPRPQVTLNWENVAHRWVAPEDLPCLSHVPLLPETLGRVVLPQYMQCHVDSLVANRYSGAAELAQMVLQMMDAVEKYERKQGLRLTWKEQMERYRDFAYLLSSARPAMAPIANTAVEVICSLEEALRSRADPFEVETGLVRVAMEDALRNCAKALASAHERLGVRVEELLRDHTTFLTLSFSSTVLKGLVHAKTLGSHPSGPRSISAIVCESRPLHEGVILAAKLAETGIRTTLITEAQVALFMKDVDLVLLGADAITPRGVVNKVGSYAVALVAKAFGVPVYAVTDSLKISPGQVTELALPNTKLNHEGEAKDPEEVMRTWGDVRSQLPEWVKVSNIYFEVVPLELISGVVTENGLLSPQQIDEEVEARRRRYLQAFQLEMFLPQSEEGSS